MNQLSIEDLNHILKHTLKDLRKLKKSNILITGGTGFIGKWLVGSLIYMNENEKLNLQITILTRNSCIFKEQFPQIALCPYISFIEGDIRNFQFIEIHYDFIIHAATEASAKLNIEDPFLMYDVIVNGTKHLLDFAVQCQAKKVLFVSSGAIYGKQPDDINGFSEDYSGAPNPFSPDVAYAESKRMAEFLCACFSRNYNIEISVARCFAFVGPYLPLDTHFAIGNFINDGLNKRDITITGNGEPFRSYMYASDMTIWLLTILLNGKNEEAYNVGSSKAISIKDLAYTVADFFPKTKVNILNQSRITDRNQNYIPNINKATSLLGLKEIITLKDAIEKTIKYYTYEQKSQSS
jgi:Nucleoside-diphosphate-sugar epimerases